MPIAPLTLKTLTTMAADLINHIVIGFGVITADAIGMRNGFCYAFPLQAEVK